ncbi:CaiB/BaiF CoA transferase family protein [Pikeienuella sp. HZG-20]|uniref:CaiB/BaiF CoA transferase family protein n=1 Tax=Paludibacillus litoralis TaxID=3133267 RepID=UPI0030EB51BD
MTKVQPYSGIRILDLTHDLGRYATRLFADLGAEVVRVEPPQGLPDRHRSAERAREEGENTPDWAFLFFNASKKSVVLDFDTEEGRSDFARLIEPAQIVFLERGGPLADELGWVRSLNPTAVITIVSPYGLGGPLTDAPACDLTMQASGGIAWLSGRPGEPPLRLPVAQSAMIASVYAASATAVALFDAERGGVGHLIDVSAQECIAHSLQNAIQVYDLEGRVSQRGGEGTRDASEDIFSCRDGYVFLASPPTLGVSWKSLVEWMREVEHPSAEEFSKERWLDRPWRTTAEARTIFRRTFEAFIRDFTKEEVTREAIRRKIVMSSVNRVRDVLTDPQLQHRDYFVSLADPRLEKPVLFPGAPYRLSEDVWSLSPAPELGQHNDLLKAAPTASNR